MATLYRMVQTAGNWPLWVKMPLYFYNEMTYTVSGGALNSTQTKYNEFVNFHNSFSVRRTIKYLMKSSAKRYFWLIAAILCWLHINKHGGHYNGKQGKLTELETGQGKGLMNSEVNALVLKNCIS